MDLLHGKCNPLSPFQLSLLGVSLIIFGRSLEQCSGIIYSQFNIVRFRSDSGQIVMPRNTTSAVCIIARRAINSADFSWLVCTASGPLMVGYGGVWIFIFQTEIAPSRSRCNEKYWE